MKCKQYLILGMGRFGSSLARKLCSLGQEVLAVDSNADLVDDIAEDVTQAIQMDAADEGALRSLGVNNFDAAIVSIGSSMRESILICMLLKELDAPYVIAKANDDLHGKVLQKIGVDRVILPERDMGEKLAQSIIAPNALDLMNLSDGYQIMETRLPRKWIGNSIVDINVRRKYGISILAIHREERFIVAPAADMLFEAGDTLLVMGKTDDIEKIDE